MAFNVVLLKSFKSFQQHTKMQTNLFLIRQKRLSDSLQNSYARVDVAFARKRAFQIRILSEGAPFSLAFLKAHLLH